MISTKETKKFNVDVEADNITMKSIQPVEVDENRTIYHMFI